MPKFFIIGGLLGGMLAANVLPVEGHDVGELENVRSSMDGRDAGIVTHDALFAGLQRAGLHGTKALGVQVQQRVALDVDGQAVVLLEMPQILMSWSRLYQALHQLLPADRYVQGAVVHGKMAKGAKSWSADLVIASDGNRSVVRQQLAPQVPPQYAG